jgi:hypothetical protein
LILLYVPLCSCWSGSLLGFLIRGNSVRARWFDRGTQRVLMKFGSEIWLPEARSSNGGFGCCPSKKIHVEKRKKEDRTFREVARQGCSSPAGLSSFTLRGGVRDEACS